ncbi:hypothetical protein WOLCODRAFT_139276 [Wolfiporia cocos MD-104 SS10]|uniref:F-box domain-containing protein n=1 Tax=Wolfiporia cocos (strain MD-104) TaxID=742152 RepID=A0A2H3K0X1_WOLCO|nr:hypothetical protein WOLCODRAFT_139276 [Wolfiporia cocos MD-104 SS10]
MWQRRRRTFLSLPEELLHHILCMLDFRSLLRCRQVCRYFAAAIQNSSSLQYPIELAVSNMEDGPCSALGPAARLRRLKTHREAWDTLNYTMREKLPILEGAALELYKGILVQVSGDRTIHFRQLPSSFRDIDERSWTIEDVGFAIADIGIDPSQDLLVVIEKPPTDGNPILIHLRKLFMDEPHPCAKSPGVLSHNPQGIEHTYTIDVCEDLLGVLFDPAPESDFEIVVWNWKTGVRQFWCHDRHIMSFTFLSNREILLGLVCRSHQTKETREQIPMLVVVDVRDAYTQQLASDNVDFLCEFHFPRLAAGTEPSELAICAKPAPSPHARPHMQVPFYPSNHDRLLVMTLWAFSDDIEISTMLFVLSSAILSHVRSLQGRKGHCFHWEEWGPENSRLMQVPHDPFSLWVRYACGTKFISAPSRDGTNGVQIFDFNPLPIRRWLAKRLEADKSDTEISQYITQSTVLKSPIFAQEVTSALPYRVHALKPLTLGGDNEYDYVMLCEDSIIILGTDHQYHIFTF